LTKSVNYGELAHYVEQVFTEKSYDLIETAAQVTADSVLKKYNLIENIKIKIKKPWAPIGRHLEYVAVEIERGWHDAYLSIGSNMGDKVENLNKAVEFIKKNDNIIVEKISSFIETEPWGNVNQDVFVNGALKLKTILSPKELLKFLLEIEKNMHRVRIEKWGPRIIDLDLILYDDIVTSDDFVTIPHPRMEEREFVLEPLCEIAPNKIHPLLKKRMFRLLEELRDKQ